LKHFAWHLSMTVVQISTITLSVSIPNCILNLTNIGKYLNIDNYIVGIKYKYADLDIIKGNYFTTLFKKSKSKSSVKAKSNLFYNQVTIIYNNNGNFVNVKLFGNGSLHLTGCKTICEGRLVAVQLYEKLLALKEKNDTVFLTKDDNHVWLDKDKLVYSVNKLQTIGYKKNESTYVIHKKEYNIDVKTGMFIACKYQTGRRRCLLNFDGESIGYNQIELLKNKNKFYKQNNNVLLDYENEMIFYQSQKTHVLIGRIKYYMDIGKLTKANTDDCFEIDYSCNPFQSFDELSLNKIDVNVNCMNVYFNIDFKLNRQKMYEQLIKDNYICKYNPESYSGIKVIFKLSKDNASFGHCSCNNKCTCVNITFMIFQSGNVIATGFKNEEQIRNSTDHFLSFCEKYKESIKMKPLTLDK